MLLVPGAASIALQRHPLSVLALALFPLLSAPLLDSFRAVCLGIGASRGQPRAVVRPHPFEDFARPRFAQRGGVKVEIRIAEASPDIEQHAPHRRLSGIGAITTPRHNGKPVEYLDARRWIELLEIGPTDAMCGAFQKPPPEAERAAGRTEDARADPFADGEGEVTRQPAALVRLVPFGCLHAVIHRADTSPTISDSSPSVSCSRARMSARIASSVRSAGGL
jgi:hypothetical protein